MTTKIILAVLLPISCFHMLVLRLNIAVAAVRTTPHFTPTKSSRLLRGGIPASAATFVAPSRSRSTTTSRRAPPSPFPPLLIRGGGGASISHPSTFSERHSSWGFQNQDSGYSDGKGDDEEPRTGWLHNTEPKQKASRTPDPSGFPSSLAARRLAFEMMKKRRNHRIVSPPAFHSCGNDKRAVVTEHKIAVPLTHRSSGSDGAEPSDRLIGAGIDPPTVDIYFSVIQVVTSSSDEAFFTSIADLALSGSDRAAAYVRHARLRNAEGMVLYLQGGPGFGSPAPFAGISMGEKGSWAAEALLGGATNRNGKAFDRVVLMDQRGTGRSSPITRQTIEKTFPDLFSMDASTAERSSNPESAAAEEVVRAEGDPAKTLTAAKMARALEEATEYLSKFRADSIVRDAELVKESLFLPSSVDGDGSDADGGDGPRPWGAALGQSFGGFCLMSYLSLVPDPPQLCFFTGGVAPMLTPTGEVYDRLWMRVRERNMRYYEQYPGDVVKVKRIIKRLLKQPAILPSGGRLTARRFLGLGIGLGGSPSSSFASLHSLVSSAFLEDGDGGDLDGDNNSLEELSRSFLKRLDSEQSFDDAPLYFLLHESIYADGPDFSPTDWAADDAYRQRAESSPEFDYTVTCAQNEASAPPTLFFGEMVFPWFAHGDYAELSGHGMLSLSRALSAKRDWTPLYNAGNMRGALRGGAAGALPKSKAAAAVYYEDMYVDFECSMRLVQRGMPLEGCKVWVTNEYQHSGLRDDGANIFRKLLGMAKGTVKVPS